MENKFVFAVPFGEDGRALAILSIQGMENL